jgi:hypothetical protein
MTGEDAEDRRKGDELVRRMLGMRPKPQEELKVGKPRRPREESRDEKAAQEGGPSLDPDLA